MRGSGQPEWMSELEVSDLIWCAAHLHHILVAPPQSEEDLLDGDDEGISTSDAEVMPGLDRGSTTADMPVPPTTPIYPKAPPKLPETQTDLVEAMPSKASPVRIPDPFPLPQTFELGKALLPLGRRIESVIKSEIDIDQTVDQMAEVNGLPMLVYRSPLERWFDLFVLIDQSATMDLWGDLSAGISTLFKWQGIFRDVRTLYFDTHSEDMPQLLAGTERLERDIRSLLAPGRNRIFIVVTDTLGRAWQSGQAFEMLSILGERHPVSVVHVFPPKLWVRTAMSSAILRPFVADHAGCPNVRLKETKRVRTREELHRFSILNLTTLHLKTWANFMAGGPGSIQGFLIKSPGRSAALEDTVQESPQGGQQSELSPKEKLQDFLMEASPEARKLIQVFAAVPLIPPVMRLAQQRFVRESQYWHLAEIFFSGLVQRSQFGDAEAGVLERWYEFIPDVRQLVLQSSPVNLTTQVHRAISDFVEERYGSPRDFSARILNEQGSLSDVELNRNAFFAEVRANVLLTWGGEYAKRGKQMLQQVQSLRTEPKVPSPEPDTSEKVDDLTDGFEEFIYEPPKVSFEEEDWPRIQTQVVQVATVAFQRQLQSFDFNVITYRKDLIGRVLTAVGGSGWRAQKSQQQAKRYIEQISEDVELEMVAIPGGTFRMGSAEQDFPDDEKPQHSVQVQGFFMGRYPITQKQWRAVAALPQVGQSLESNPSGFKGDDLPVEQVSWQDAMEFCQRLSHLAETEYRLPSEAEWEYACRAGTTTPFHFGEMISPDVANYNGSPYQDGPKGKRRDETTPVSEFKCANAFGLSDMHGNVWEWCEDIWHESYDDAPADGRPWLDKGDDKYRVLRGGSWNYNPAYCRSASRGGNTPANRSHPVGFRVVSVSRGTP